MAHEWQMPRRGEACVSCGAAFEIGQPLRAYLFESPAGYERKDFCETCRPQNEADAIGFWTTRRPAPQARKSAPFDKAAMLSFFERLDGAESPEKRQFRFVLGLLLWRRKALRLDHSKRVDGEEEVWRFSSPAGEQVYHVVQPDLDDATIEQLSRQLEDALTGGASEPADDTEPAYG